VKGKLAPISNLVKNRFLASQFDRAFSLLSKWPRAGPLQDPFQLRQERRLAIRRLKQSISELNPPSSRLSNFTILQLQLPLWPLSLTR